MRTRKRIQLSFVAEKTQKLLFWILCGFALSLGAVYLFLMNHLAMEGYVLTKESQTLAQLTNNIEKLDAQAARLQTREYVSKFSDSNAMIARVKNKFVVVRETFTAQK